MERLDFLKNSKNLFGNLVKIEWITGIDIDKKGRLKSNLVLVRDTSNILKEPEELDLSIEIFQLRTHDILDENDVNSLFGENKKNGSSYCYGRRSRCC